MVKARCVRLTEKQYALLGQATELILQEGLKKVGKILGVRLTSKRINYSIVCGLGLMLLLKELEK